MTEPTQTPWTLRLALAWFAAYAALAIVITYPLVRVIATRVPHDLGDPLLSTVLLWWNAHHVPLTAGWWNVPFFYPASGAMAFSDHRLGVSLVASPLQWAGSSPLSAYNITLLATFPLCALGAHWAASTVTGRHDAALVAGLAYGFNPYRFAHIEHLELLAAFGMPVALGAMHKFLASRERRWLALFAGSLFIQALASSYYFLFFLVMVGLWIVWFVRLRDYRIAVGILAATAAAALAISPIAFRILAIHRQYGMVRPPQDIITLSADLTSLVTAAPLSALWGWTATLNGPERQLFPGLTMVLLVAAGAAAAARSERARPSHNRTSLVLLAVSVLFAIIAAAAWRFGAWRLGPISVGVPFKPFSVAVCAAGGAVLASSRVRGAYRRRSALAFYVLAAAFLFLCSLGPKAAFLHQQVLYEPPYAWLMRLPIFGESLRVPARFGMPAILALSIAASAAFVRLTKNGRAPVAIAAAIVAGLLADSWIKSLPLLEPPAAWPWQVSTAGTVSVLELPLGDTLHDAAAMYRTLSTGLPTANGMSGFMPAHYTPLRLGLEEHDDSVLDVLAARGPLLVAVERAWPRSAEALAWLTANERTRVIAENDDFVWLVAPVSAPTASPACSPEALPIRALRDARGPLTETALLDGDPATWWVAGEAQRAGDFVVIDLGSVRRPCSIRISLGQRVDAFPRSVSIASSLEGSSWTTSFSGRLGGETVRAAIENPLDAVIELPVAAPARYVRLQLESDRPMTKWMLSGLEVRASRSN